MAMEFLNRDVEKCCCCCELRTGNIVLGITNAVFSGCGVLLAYLMQEYNEEEQSYEPYSGLAIILLTVCLCKFFFDVLFIYGVVKGLQNIVKAYYIMYMVFVFFWVVMSFSCVILFEWGHLINTALHILIDGYSGIVCRSYYRKLLNHEIV